MKAFFRSILLSWIVASQLLAADRELIITSPHWEGVQYEFGTAFERTYHEQTGHTVAIHWLDLGGTSQIEKIIEAQYKTDPATCGIDVFFGGGIDPFQNLKSQGHLQSFKLPATLLAIIPPTVAGVPLVDPDYMYYGAAVSSFGILENVKIHQRLGLPPVRTWEDLARPEFFNWVSSADPRKSGSVHMIYEIILQAYGWEKGWAVINQTSANVRSFFQSSSMPTKEVTAGDAAEAVTIDLNGLVEVAALGTENVRFIIPQGLSVMTPDAIAILKGAPNRDVAEAFVTFVMSAQGQALWMKPIGAPGGPERYPISRMGVWPPYYEGDLHGLPIPLNPFQTAPGFVYNGALGGKRWNVVNDLIGQTVIDVHSRAQKAWAAILRLPEAKRAPLIAAFSQPPISEADALQCAAFWKTDRLRASHLANGWMSAAAARYDSIAQQAKLLLHEN